MRTLLHQITISLPSRAEYKLDMLLCLFHTKILEYEVSRQVTNQFTITNYQLFMIFTNQILYI